jgi:putative protease
VSPKSKLNDNHFKGRCDMKLLAPVNSLESAEMQIDAGADEIYFGMDTDDFNNFSLNGRGRKNEIGKQNSPGYNEMKQIIKYAHEHNVKVMYAANIPYIADDPTGSRKFMNSFYDYVDKGVCAGADSIIVADLGAILFLRGQGLKTHITASTFFETINREQILFFKEIGVNRAVLSYQMVLDEITELAGYNDMEIEVFGHYGCSFYEGCNLNHNFGEAVTDNLGIPCRSFYKICKDGIENERSQYLNAALICGACSIWELAKSGVYAFKLVGRDFDMNHNREITMLYSNLLNKVSTGNLSEAEYQAYRVGILPDWWKRVLCEKKQCKYLKNSVTDSYIGLRSR